MRKQNSYERKSESLVFLFGVIIVLMAMPRNRRTTSLRDSDTRFASDSDNKIEGAGSWDAIEWTKIDVI